MDVKLALKISEATGLPVAVAEKVAEAYAHEGAGLAYYGAELGLPVCGAETRCDCGSCDPYVSRLEVVGPRGSYVLIPEAGSAAEVVA